MIYVGLNSQFTRLAAPAKPPGNHKTTPVLPASVAAADGVRGSTEQIITVRVSICAVGDGDIMPTYYRNRWGRTTGGHNITIQGKPINIHFARLTHLCIHCLAPLKLKNAGLACTENPNHYGFISQKEADSLTDEERFMKISDMFPSEYLRGIDISEPRKMKIIKVETEMVKNRESGKMQPESVVHFEGEPKKMRLNMTNTREAHFEIFDLSPDEEPCDCWPGRYVTVYREKKKMFGKTQIVPVVRKPKQGDKIWPPQTGKEKPIYKLNRHEFWGRVKRDLDLPVEVSKFVLIQEKSDGEYKPENAQTMWAILEETGTRLNTFLDAVMEDIPYYTKKQDILDILTEWGVDYRFEEQTEMELIASLETRAKSYADIEQAEQVDQLGFNVSQPGKD